jgi:hypothetical protein
MSSIDSQRRAELFNRIKALEKLSPQQTAQRQSTD